MDLCFFCQEGFVLRVVLGFWFKLLRVSYGWEDFTCLERVVSRMNYG